MYSSEHAHKKEETQEYPRLRNMLEHSVLTNGD